MLFTISACEERQRIHYTREELLALRESLEYETLPNPVHPDCPMLKDCEVPQETTVMKRQKVLKRKWESGESLCRDSVACSGVGNGFTSARHVGAAISTLQREGFGTKVFSNASAGNMLGENIVSGHTGRVILPPRLCVPVVTIAAPPKRRVSRTDAPEVETQVNVETEREMITRFRQLQQRRQEAPPGRSSVTGKLSENGLEACSDNRQVPPLHEASVSSSFVYRPNRRTVGTSLRATPMAETAVPIANVSLFKSDAGSRYFQFTRTLGLWEYLSTFSTFGPMTQEPHMGPSETNRLASGDQSSVGPEESGTLGADDNPCIPTEHSVPLTKRAHRRRTNRTHAEKRLHRITRANCLPLSE
ncbi:hypothetical protein TRVL_06965 [Trypanosoma vivax]|nr:hypothetical protein TRVL_06965 [Trypanosoma vivax]